MKKTQKTFDVVVIGGGLAGFCAAVAAAREGSTTALVANRPVLGGNSSSEIGVTPHGAAAFHAYARETGILSEALIQERKLNHAEIYENGWTNSVWDMVLYDIAASEDRLELFLNTDFVDVVMEGDDAPRNLMEVAGECSVELGYYHRPSRNEGMPKISRIIAQTQNAETELDLEAGVFIDCTGDGLVADRAGCEWRMGSESKEEFNEVHAPSEASTDTMGNSIHFRCRNIGTPTSYKAPDWAKHYDDASYFYDCGRIPKDERGGFWWLEIGVPYHTIHDNETIRHELTRHALGVWEWMKNKDPIMKERTKNYALEWIGQVPGKRESRRIMGNYFMTENDIQAKTVFEDEIAFGGWFVDLHTPGGLLAEHAEASAATEGEEYDTFSEYSVKSYCGPYGIPLRICIAKDVENLMMAGRNVSTTHAALGTIRVMATTALLGEACGVAAAYATRESITPADTSSGKAIHYVQQTLLRNGCFLPNVSMEDGTNLATSATISASSTDSIGGAGPDSVGAHEGLAVWRDQPQYDVSQMTVRKAQWIALGAGGVVDSIAVCLDNTSGSVQTVKAYVYAVDHIWDYRVTAGEPIAMTTLEVPVGSKQWVKWPVHLEIDTGSQSGKWIRIDLGANENLRWLEAGKIIPGHMGVYQIGENQYRRFGNGSTLSYQISPTQNSFAPEQVSTGSTRPHRLTNLWKSDSSQPLPQSLELAWDTPKQISRVELTFPGHLIREYHAYAPFYVDPQCPKDYRVEVEKDGKWQTVASAKENFQRKVAYTFDQISIAKLRILIDETNGDPAAQIYEVRCYE